MPKHPVEPATEPASPEFENRFPRRLLFATAAAGLTTVGVVAAAAPAEAAPPATAWMLGGNTSVSTNNFLGPTNAGAPLIFKTKGNSTSALTEKMRLTADGKLGLGTTTPGAKLDSVTGSIAVRGTTTSTATDGRGVVGVAPNGYGVSGTSNGNIGVYGQGSSAGVSGVGTSYGVSGVGTSYGAYFSGGNAGVYSYGGTYGVQASGSASGTGVYGSGATGVSGFSTSSGGVAVSGTGGQYGVRGINGVTAGVRGDSNYVGVWAEAPTYGLYANSTATTGQVYGVYGRTSSPAGYAVFSQGNAHVNGTLSKSAGSFRINHPLDPENQWLSHSFVESPDMMNIYNGNATTDARGAATIALPSYFAALNRDFRYQLTVIGDFAQAVVSKEVTDNSFAIKTDKPNVKVSWQVTGIRRDSYAQEHPIVVETPKDKPDAGTRSFVPQGSSAKAAPTAPGTPADVAVPTAPKEASKPLDKATT